MEYPNQIKKPLDEEKCRSPRNNEYRSCFEKYQQSEQELASSQSDIMNSCNVWYTKDKLQLVRKFLEMNLNKRMKLRKLRFNGQKC